ncbi:hypothetical protein PT974_10328 [Cladobotryum mycophilum]|uniref:Uncharacterized protein n=1 Tax=Cladobotryum mycophilum TaxID=491253 RepID=A0ABR0SA27_9HYPO
MRAFSLIPLAFATSAVAQTAGQGASGNFWQEANYRGWNQGLSVIFKGCLNLEDPMLNHIHAVQTGPGFTCFVYYSRDCTGRSQAFTSDTPNIADGNVKSVTCTKN